MKYRSQLLSRSLGYFNPNHIMNITAKREFKRPTTILQNESTQIEQQEDQTDELFDE
jgi:hypothetical protein